MAWHRGASPSVAVGVLCYQQQELISAAIESVFAQTVTPVQVLVADDGSTDDSVGRIQTFPVTLLRHDENRGRTAVRNTITDACRADILVFLDGDTVATPELVETLVSEYAEDNVAGVGGRGVEVNTDGPANRWRARHAVQSWGDRPLVNPPFLFGLSSSYRLDWLRRAGPWVGPGEDQIIGRRLRAFGCQLRYNPMAKVLHRRDDDVKSLSHMMYRWWRAGYLVRASDESMPLTRILGRLGLDVYQHAIEDLLRDPDLPVAMLEFPLLVARLQGIFQGWRHVRNRAGATRW